MGAGKQTLQHLHAGLKSEFRPGYVQCGLFPVCVVWFMFAPVSAHPDLLGLGLCRKDVIGAAGVLQSICPLYDSALGACMHTPVSHYSETARWFGIWHLNSDSITFLLNPFLNSIAFQAWCWLPLGSAEPFTPSPGWSF